MSVLDQGPGALAERMGIFRGVSVATYQIVITDETGERVCTARLTCQLRGV